MAYTFSGSRYITSGVAENFPIELQVALFSAVEQMSEKVSGQLDYLQIFEIVTEVKGRKNSCTFIICRNALRLSLNISYRPTWR